MKTATIPTGKVGELIVKGPGLMTCYYRDETATNASLKDGWLYTGDMAQQDEDGFIFLVDRKRMLSSPEENLYPVQIENFIRTPRRGQRCCGHRPSHKRLGEIAGAIVELKEGATLTEEELNKFCEELPR